LLKTALIVDDSSSMRAMLSVALASAGFEVVQGADGTEGLAILDRQAVDIVITDLTMSGMDGITFIRELRARAKHQSTPILILTTETQEARKQAARMAGATGWMLKPFNPEQLLALVARVIP
jgi:two-component system chemotaxis response regulator CheY